MNITMNLFGLIGVLILAVASGFWLGRRDWSMERVDEGGDDSAESKSHVLCRSTGSVVCSPVSGRVKMPEEKNGRSILILPDEGKLYAPGAGKVIKICPMGNAFFMRLDIGTEIWIRVGNHPDELCAMCFRPRVVQNEIVHKGQLLLVYDREFLLSEGENVAVTVEMTGNENGKELVFTEKADVKVGDELLKIYS